MPARLGATGSTGCSDVRSRSDWTPAAGPSSVDSSAGAGGGEGSATEGSTAGSTGCSFARSASSEASYAARRSGSSRTSAASLNIRNWPEPEPGSNLSVALRHAALISAGEASRETPSTSYHVGLGEEGLTSSAQFTGLKSSTSQESPTFTTFTDQR